MAKKFDAQKALARLQGNTATEDKTAEVPTDVEVTTPIDEERLSTQMEIGNLHRSTMGTNLSRLGAQLPDFSVKWAYDYLSGETPDEELPATSAAKEAIQRKKEPMRGGGLRDMIARNYDLIKGNAPEGDFVDTKYRVAEEMVNNLPLADRNYSDDVMLGDKRYKRADVLSAMRNVVEETMHPTLLSQNDSYRDNYFIENYGKNYNDWATERLGELEHLLDNLERSLRAEVSKDVAEVQSTMSSLARSEMVITPDVAQALITSEGYGAKQIRDARDKIRSIRDNDFSSGLKEGFDMMSALSMGLTDLVSNVQLGDVLDKAFSGKALTQREQIAYDAYAVQEELDNIQEMLGGRSIWNTIGQGVGVSAEVALPMFAGMNVLGAGAKLNSLGIKTAGRLTRRAFKQSVIKGLKTAVVSSGKIGWRAGKNVLKAEAYGLIAAPFMPTTYAQYSEKRNEQFSLENGRLVYKPREAWKDAVNTWIEAGNELASEFIGVRIGEVVGGSARAFGRMLGIDKIANKIGLGKASDVIFGWKKPAAWKRFERNVGFTGNISEPLSEVWGDAMSNLMKEGITGEGDFSQLSSPEYWATTLAVSTIYGGSLQLATAPSVVARYANIAKQTARRKKAMSKIESAELCNKLNAISAIEDISEASMELSKIEWDNYSMRDKGYAMDFIRADYAQRVAISAEAENGRMRQFEQRAVALSNMTYRGKDGKENTEQIVQLKKGDDVYTVISGNSESEFYICIDANGNKVSIPVADDVELSAYGLSEQIVLQYQEMFTVSSEQQRQENIIEAYESLVDSKNVEEDIASLMRQLGVKEHNEGDEVTLASGSVVVVDSFIPNKGEYIVSTADGAKLVVPFYDVLSADPLTAEAQSLNYASRTVNNAELTLDAEVNAEATAPADTGGLYNIGDIVVTPQGEQVRVRGISEDGTYEVDYNLDPSPLIDDMETAIFKEEELSPQGATAASTPTIAEENVLPEETTMPEAEVKVVPVKDNGSIDFDAINDASQFAMLYEQEAGSREDAIADIMDMRSATEESMQKSMEQGKKATSASDKIANRKQRKALAERMAFYDEVLSILQPTESVAEGILDKQGNLMDSNGNLIVEEVSSVKEITDGDFLDPQRSIMLPPLPTNVDKALGANGKRVIIKKNIFERNAIRHSDITPAQSREILQSALYSPTLYGKNQKSRKPYNWVVISIATNDGANKLVLLEINNNKNNVEIVHWHYIDDRGIEKIKRQAEREDGQLLILPPEMSGEVGALSDPTLNVPSENKDTQNIPNNKENNTKTSGLVDNAYSKQLNTAIADTIDAMSKALGVRVTFVDKVVTDSGSVANANIIGREVLISWEFRDKAIDFLVGHEFTHRMQDLSPEAYAAYKESVKAYMGEEVWNERMARMRSIYTLNRVSASDATLEDEIVADFTGMMVEEHDVFNKYLEANKENKGLIQTIADVLRSILDKLRAITHRTTALDNVMQTLDTLISSASAVAESADVANSDNRNSIPSEVLAEIEAERKAIIDTAKANGTYLKAPNGKKTNLTPEQWVDVRTSRFKKWFGDWEKAVHIEKLRSSESVAISGKEFEITDDFKQNKKNALKYSQSFTGKYTNADTGDVIGIYRGRQNGGVNEVLQHNYKDVPHIQSIAAIPQIIEKSIYIESQPNNDPDTNPDVAEYQCYVCGLNIAGEEYTVLAKVAVDKNGNRYYDHNLTAVAKGKLIDIANNEQSAVTSGFGTTPDTESTTNSQRKYRELISILQTNSSKIVDANGEPMVVYHGTRDKFNTFIRRADIGYHFGTKGTARVKAGRGKSAIMMHTFLNSRNPLTFDKDLGSWEADYVVRELLDMGLMTDAEAKSILLLPNGQRRNSSNANKDLRTWIADKGYDGFVYPNWYESDGKLSYMVFNPNQIKSATDNVGTYDANNPDIRFSLRSDVADILNEYDNDGVKYGSMLDVADGIEVVIVESTEDTTELENILNDFRAAQDDARRWGNRMDSGGEEEFEEALRAYVVQSEETEDDGYHYFVRQPIFYSNAEYAVRGIKQEKATPEQWLKMIEKNGGLKASEDKWLGLSDWLKASDKKTLTKDEVLQYIAENDIQIEEVEYEQGIVEDDGIPEYIYDGFEEIYNELRDSGEYDHFEAVEVAWEQYCDDAPDWMKEAIEARAYSDGTWDLKVADSYVFESHITQNGSNAINSTRLQYTTQGLENKREIALVVPTIEPWNTSDEIHFGDAGEGRAVAWIRFGETIDAEDKRVLVIDEIQSKRHQEGREKGYRPIQLEKEILLAKEKLAEANRELGDYKSGLKEKYDFKNIKGSFFERHQIFYDALLAEERAQLDTLAEKRNDAEAKWQSLQLKATGIPSAPFEKNWAELAMKRMLRYAAENGFDKVAWTTGEQQAERYDLGKSIDYIEAQRNENGTYNLNVATNDDSHYVQEDYISESRLSEVLGKDMMQSIVKGTQDSEDGSVIIEGDGLRIGGEGMKGFYDQMLPSFVRKYAKKWGATVGEVTMPDLEENNTMHAVDVTDAMRESVMQGQPKFSLREVNDRFNAELATLTEENKDKINLSLGMPSDILLAAGVVNKPMKLYGAKLWAKSQKHGYKVSDLRDLPKNVAEPIAIFKGSTDGSHAVLTEIKVGENNVLATLSVGKGGEDIDFNIISSVYGKQGDNVVKWIDDGKLEYIDKEKALNYLHHSAPIAEALSNPRLISTTKVIQNFENPKIEPRFSLMRPTDEEVTFGNFFDNTSAVFTLLPKSEAPQREADYESKRWDGFGVSSRYWYGEDEQGKYVVRASDHWSSYPRGANSRKAFEDNPYHRIYTQIASCRWALDMADAPGVATPRPEPRASQEEWDAYNKARKAQKAAFEDTYIDGKTMYGKAYLDDFTKWKAETRYSFQDLPFFVDDEGEVFYFNDDTEVTDRPRNVQPRISEDVIRTHIDSRHIANIERIRKETREMISLIRKVYKENDAKRREQIGTLRTNAAKVDYILGKIDREGLPLEDRALMLIALKDVKIRWDDDGIKKGLASELGYGEGEKRSYSGITKGSTQSFDGFVHSWWESMGGYERGIDTQDLRNALIDALRDAPTAKRALAILRAKYDNNLIIRDESIRDAEAQEEVALAQEQARYEAELSEFNNAPDKSRMIHQYEQDMVLYDEFNAIRHTINELERKVSQTRSKLERARRLPNGQLAEIRKAVEEAKKTIKAAIDESKVSKYNSRELKQLLANIDSVRSIRDVERLFDRIKHVLMNAQIRRNLDDMGRLLNLRLPNGQLAESWIGNQVAEGKMSATEAKRLMSDMWRGTDGRGVRVAKWMDGGTIETLEYLRKYLILPIHKRRRVVDGVTEVNGVEKPTYHFEPEQELTLDVNNERTKNDERIDKLVDKKENDAGKFTSEMAAELGARRLYDEYLLVVEKKQEYQQTRDKIEVEKDSEYADAKSKKRAISNLYKELLANKEAYDAAIAGFNASISSVMAKGRKNLRTFREQKEARLQEVIALGLDATQHITKDSGEPNAMEKIQARHRNVSPYYTFQTVLKTIDYYSPNGEGAFYRHFMHKAQEANDMFCFKMFAHFDRIKDKLDELFPEHKGKHTFDAYLAIMKETDEINLGTITYYGKLGKGGRPVDKTTTRLNLSNAMYLLAMWKQPRYQATMVKCGITEEQIADLESRIPEKYQKFMEWVNDTFLPDTRLEYDEVHRAMFGISMDAEVNYFPAKILGVLRTVDISDPDAKGNDKPSTTTGAIKRRVDHSQMPDLRMGYMQMLQAHIQNMDKWSSYAPLNEELNALASNNEFKDRLNSYMPGVKADRSGKGSLYTLFVNASAVMADCYTAQAATGEDFFLSLQKKWAISNISGRMLTAIKQFSGTSVFMAYGLNKEMLSILKKTTGEAITHPQRLLERAIELSPSFRQRFLGRTAGSEILAQEVSRTDSLADLRRSERGKARKVASKIDDVLTKVAADYGMLPNVYADAYASAVGLLSIYDFEIKQMTEGKREATDEEKKLALLNAEIAMNESQQSAEGAYISTLQKQRSLFAAGFTTYMNATFGLHRLRMAGAEELFKQLTDKKYMQSLDKSTAKQARRKAISQLLMGILGDVNFYIATKGIPWVFNLLSRGEDDDERSLWQRFRDFLLDNTINMVVQPIPFVGPLIVSAYQGYEPTLLPMWNDLLRDGAKVLSDRISTYSVLNFLSTYGYGVDLDTYVNMVLGIEGLISGDGNAESIMKMLNAPKTQINAIAGQVRAGETVEEYITRRMRLESLWGFAEYEELFTADGRYIGDKHNNPLMISAYQAKKLRSEYEEKYRRGVVLRIGGRKELRRMVDIDDKYANGMKEMGWTPNAHPNNKATSSGRYVAPIDGLEYSKYERLRDIADAIADLNKDVEHFVGRDEVYYKMNNRLNTLKEQFINKYNEFIE